MSMVQEKCIWMWMMCVQFLEFQKLMHGSYCFGSFHSFFDVREELFLIKQIVTFVYSSVNVTRIYTSTTESVFQKRIDRFIEQKNIRSTT